MPMATARTASGSTSASTVHIRPAQLMFHQKKSETSATATKPGRSLAKPYATSAWQPSIPAQG